MQASGAAAAAACSCRGTPLPRRPPLQLPLVVVLLLLLATGSRAQQSAPASSDNATNSSSSTNSSTNSSSDSGLLGRMAEQLLQRIQLALQQPSNLRPPAQQQAADGDSSSSSSSLAAPQDFASTANALTQQAVKEANVRAAALAQRAAFEASSNSTGNLPDDLTGTTASVAAQQLMEQQQQQQTANGTDSSSDGDPLSGLQLLLQTIKQSWEGTRSRQRARQQQQQQQEQSPAAGGRSNGGSSGAQQPDVGEQWAASLEALGAKHPSLSAFARLVRNNSAIAREVSQTQLLPSIILAPTNAVLADFLRALQALTADAAGAGRSGAAGGGSSSSSSSSQDAQVSGASAPPPQQSWQQLVDAFASDTESSLMLLRRHFLPARQPHLLDAKGNINSQLLVHSDNPLVFNSLVLRTSLGTYIAVSELPSGPAANRLLQVVNPKRLSAAAAAATSGRNNSTSSTAPTASGTHAQPGQGGSNATTASVPSRLLHVGQAGSAVARPFPLSPSLSNVLVVPVDTVLTEHDEVVNSRTAARLRGAFGWSPEDEQALLSAVYLDPAASFWSASSGREEGSAGDSNSSGQASSTGSSGSSSSSSSQDGGSTVPAFVAETRARQQQMLVQMQMADALAANLMTVEAISAWVSAAVLNPAAVFDSASLQRLPRLPAALSDGSTNSSSNSSDACWSGDAGSKGSGSRHSSTLNTCPLVDWASTCINLPCTPVCDASLNSSGSSSTCPVHTAASAASAGASTDSSNSSSASDSTSSRDSGETAVSGAVAYKQASRGFCGRISNAWVVGLSPSQLYPGLGRPGSSSSSSTGSAGSGASGGSSATSNISSSNVESGSSNSSSSSGGGSGSGGANNRRRGRRALRQTAATTTNSSSSSDDAAAPRPADDDLAFMPVLQLAQLLADRTVTPQQLLAAFSARMQRYTVLNAVVTQTDALAQQQAAAAQQALSAAAPADATASSRSLLCGMPYGLKDLFSVPGYPTTWGLAAFRNRTISTPSWSYSALSGSAGAVLLAKTATGELAWGDSWFDNSITTRNPWNTDTGSCGSSAGSAAAVAAGLLPFAIGSETWGSVVCPATTVSVTAYRPSGGTVPTNGLLQVSPSLDKTGIFCRQVLDCAVVADALMDTDAAAAAAAAPVPAAARLHRQSPVEAAAFNYSLFQTQPQQQQQPASGFTSWANSSSSSTATSTVLPASFQALPRLSALCIGFLQGTSSTLVSVLRSLNPACIKGPLPPPGNAQMVQDLLPTILQAEVAISFEGLWLEGFIKPHNHWYPSIQLGQLAPAATFLRAQQLRGLLLQQTRQYFAAHGVHVLLKPARSSVGLDGLAALLDMPEVLLPVDMGSATFEDADPVQSFSSRSGAASDSTSSRSEGGDSDSSSDRGSRQGAAQEAWTQPKVNSIIAPPGADAAVVAVGAAFQSLTDVHLQRPPPPPDSSSSDSGQDRVVRG